MHLARASLLLLLAHHALSAHAAELRSARAAPPPTYGNYTQAALEEATANKCHYLEQAFVELFDSPALNESRWEASSLHGLFHCPRGSTQSGSGKRGEDLFCTMALRQNLETGVALPFYPGGGTVLGAALTLSQFPCRSDDPLLAGQCCRKQKCANYSGAHAVSRGCLLYGTLTAELAVHIPGARPNNPGNPAMFDWGTYVNGGRPDASWNEIDQIFEIGPNGTVEYHTTFFDPAEHKQVFDLFSHPPYDGYMASAYKNYTVTWTPAWLSWSVDERLYRNTSAERPGANRPPWRPMTYRLILRTNNGTAAGMVPDAHVYIRRIAYEPLPSPPRPGLLARLRAWLDSGPQLLVRTALWAGCWLAGVYLLRDARAHEGAEAQALAAAQANWATWAQGEEMQLRTGS